MRHFAYLTTLLAIWVVLASAGIANAQTSVLLADDTRKPLAVVYWPTRDGSYSRHSAERRYQSSAQKLPFAPNIDLYVGLGGTRVSKGLASRDGAVLVIGLYKQDASKPFFSNISDDALVTISLERVFMSRPAVPRPETAMMHLRYMLEDLQACGLTGDARNLFITVDPADPVIKSATPGSVRAGGLAGKDPFKGTVRTKVEADGSITATVVFPYAHLRHLQDPYQRTNPGGFFEPNHFHFEIEVLPTDKVPAAQPAAEKPSVPPPSEAPSKPVDPPLPSPTKAPEEAPETPKAPNPKT